ncbi:MAG: hypothetical protein KDA65_13605, partial [Planctomycetaceae bacterium]|nr:hypothetical protein [Planctomycetaceae bacterium]
MKTLFTATVLMIFGFAGIALAEDELKPPADKSDSQAAPKADQDASSGEFKKTPGGYSFSPKSTYLTPPDAPYGTPPISDPIVVPFPFAPVTPVAPRQLVQVNEGLPRSLQGTWYEESPN